MALLAPPPFQALVPCSQAYAMEKGTMDAEDWVANTLADHTDALDQVLSRSAARRAARRTSRKWAGHFWLSKFAVPLYLSVCLGTLLVYCAVLEVLLSVFRAEPRSPCCSGHLRRGGHTKTDSAPCTSTSMSFTASARSAG